MPAVRAIAGPVARALFPMDKFSGQVSGGEITPAPPVQIRQEAKQEMEALRWGRWAASGRLSLGGHPSDRACHPRGPIHA